MHSPDLLEIPEWSIQSFERLTGLEIVVHDLTSTLWPFLHPQRFKHRSLPCLAIKATHDHACIDFEVTRLRKEIHRFPEGRYHCCHAGFVEWTIPVFIKDTLSWILFAGQRTRLGTYHHLVQDIRITKTTSKINNLLKPIRESEAEFILEHLRQLRSRLCEWHKEASFIFKKPKQGTADDFSKLVTRKMRIQKFIYFHHTQTSKIDYLAKELCLSRSRTMHLIREIFGSSFIQLVNEMRLKTAAALLRECDLSVTEICEKSGFEDLSHFHRIFRKRFLTSPLKYRHQSFV